MASEGSLASVQGYRFVCFGPACRRSMTSRSCTSRKRRGSACLESRGCSADSARGRPADAAQEPCKTIVTTTRRRTHRHVTNGSGLSYDEGMGTVRAALRLKCRQAAKGPLRLTFMKLLTSLEVIMSWLAATAGIIAPSTVTSKASDQQPPFAAPCASASAVGGNRSRGGRECTPPAAQTALHRERGHVCASRPP